MSSFISSECPLQGGKLLKYGRHGKPHDHFFRLEVEGPDLELCWESSNVRRGRETEAEGVRGGGCEEGVREPPFLR